MIMIRYSEICRLSLAEGRSFAERKTTFRDSSMTAKSANDRQDRQRPPTPSGSREPEPLAVLAVEQRKGPFANDLRELVVRQRLGGHGGPCRGSKRLASADSPGTINFPEYPASPCS